MLAVLTVNSDQDNTDSDMELTLREAILLVNNAGDANAALGRALTAGELAQVDDGTEAFGTNDTIEFFVAGTIDLSDQLPTITSSLSIDGDNQITLDAGGGIDPEVAGDGFRIFHIDDGTGSLVDVELNGLTLAGGDPSFGDLSRNGGAIFNRENLSLVHSTITGSASSRGGGIYNDGMLNVTSSTLSGNSASVYGGGIYNVATATVTSSTISGNSADRGGGIHNSFVSTANLKVTSSTIFGNSADTNGGGIYNRSGTATITSSTISGNSAEYGGGVINFATVTITNSTISGNSAVFSGGGIYNYFDSAAMLTNSIVAGSLSGGDVAGIGSLTGAHNLIEDGSGGLGDTISGDPLLGPLADNGGPTMTHALLFGSPAIGAGDASFDPDEIDPPLVNDQRGIGFDRVADGGVNGVRIDIGAYEAQAPPPELPGDYNLDEVVSIFDYILYRDALGVSVTPFSGADGNGDGVIGQGDYEVWTWNFGMSLPAAGAGAAVMEGVEESEVAPAVTSGALVKMAMAPTIVLGGRVHEGGRLPIRTESVAPALSSAESFESASDIAGRAGTIESGLTELLAVQDFSPPPGNDDLLLLALGVAEPDEAAFPQDAAAVDAALADEDGADEVEASLAVEFSAW